LAVEQVVQRLTDFDRREQSSPFLRRDSEWNDPLSVAAMLDRPDVFRQLLAMMDAQNIQAEALLQGQNARHPFALVFQHRSVKTLQFICQELFDRHYGVLTQLALQYYTQPHYAEGRPSTSYWQYRLRGVSGAAAFSDILISQCAPARRLAYLALGPKSPQCRVLLDDVERAVARLEQQFSGAMALLSSEDFEAFRVCVVSHFLKARDLKLFAESVCEQPRKQDQLIASALSAIDQPLPMPSTPRFEQLDLFYGSHEAFIQRVSAHLKEGDDELMNVSCGQIEHFLLHLLDATLPAAIRLEALESALSFIVMSQEAEPLALSVGFELLDHVSPECRDLLMEPMASRMLNLLGQERVSQLPVDQVLERLQKMVKTTLHFYVRSPAQFDTPERVRNAWCSAWDFQGEGLRPDHVIHPSQPSMASMDAFN
jgi:hypothetical protein